MLQPSLFWIVVGSGENTQGTIKTVALPHPGDTIQLTSGTACVVDRVGPPPPGSHVVLGTIYATLA